MLIKKTNCNICKKLFQKSKLKEYKTIEGNIILYCNSCKKYIKHKKINNRK